jgi:hypothetical protein
MASERVWVSPYNYVQNNPIRRTDPTGALDGDYYSKKGTHLGSDGSNDNMAYLAESVEKDDKGNVISATGSITLAVSHNELLMLSAVTYAESSEKVNNQKEKFGIASASMNNFEARKGKQSLSKVLSSISNATFDGNERIMGS